MSASYIVMLVKSGSRETQTGLPEGRLQILYATYGHDAKRLAYLMTGDVSLAEELLQEAFVRVAGRLGHLREQDRFQAYLRNTVINLVRSHYRKRIAENVHLTEITHAADMRDVAAEQDLRVALSLLPYRQRAAIILRYYVDLDDEESAELLGCRRSTVRSLIARGLATLRDHMEVLTDE